MPTARPAGHTVAVTGAAGYVAGRLIASLCSNGSVTRVLGFDVRPPSYPMPDGFVFDELDVRDPSLAARLDGVDVVVHLAFVMNPIKDEALMRDINVNGSQNVFRSAGAAGVSHLVYTSSATVYGAHPDNDVPLTEESPLRANLDFSYPAHKLEVEYVVREIREEHPELGVTLFRPAIVFGPHVDNSWSHLLELPVLPAVQGYTPPMQFVHEEDVAAALEWAVLEQVPGVFNLAPDDRVEHDQVLGAVGRRKVSLPEPMAFGLAEKLWSLGLAEAPAGLLNYVMHPWVLDPRKLQGAGFTCRRSSLDALVDTVGTTEGSIRFGSRRLDKKAAGRRTVVGAGALGSLLAWRAWRARKA